MIASPYYLFHTRYQLIRDESKLSYTKPDATAHDSLLFHLSQEDYIPTLITLLRFFEDSAKGDPGLDEEVRNMQLRILRGITDDLRYIHEHYALVPRQENNNPRA